MRRDISDGHMSRVSWCVLAAAVVWLALGGYGQEGATKPVAAGAADEPQVALGIDVGGGVSMEFILVRPGSFQTSDTDGKAVRHVTLTKPFFLGKCEVTQAQWQAVMGANPSQSKGPLLPVTNVSWNDCQQFLARFTSLNARSPSRAAFRLPTRAEWEYACRAGTKTAFSSGDHDASLGDYAWIDGNSGNRIHEVGAKKPNPWGFHDMHGNVWEWCSDWYSATPCAVATDPTGPTQGLSRVYGGGSAGLAAWFCRSAVRYGLDPGHGYAFLGFRVAFTPAPPP